MDNGTRQFLIGGVDYDGERFIGDNGAGYIELRRPGSAEPLARINYHGPGTDMDLCTYGEPVPVATVEWLISMGRDKLA